MIGWLVFGCFVHVGLGYIGPVVYIGHFVYTGFGVYICHFVYIGFGVYIGHFV